MQNRLREEFTELWEACFAGQAWLEEGPVLDPNNAPLGLVDRRGGLNSSNLTSPRQ